MTQNKELEIRHQFLEEAEEYLSVLDSSLLGLSNRRVDPQKINAALRAAHSIKGGAGMMGFQVLSTLAHRLEDSFKVLKVDTSLEIDPPLENLLLTAIDRLRWVVAYDRQHQAIEPHWVAAQIDPVFEQLHQRLGDPQDENAASLLSPEEGQDIIPLLFETEVESCLQRLETVLDNPAHPDLAEELDIVVQELGGLGEMLQLPAFLHLCTTVAQTLQTHPTHLVSITQAALQAWRRSQALILVGQSEQLPTTLDWIPPAPLPIIVTDKEVAPTVETFFVKEMTVEETFQEETIVWETTIASSKPFEIPQTTPPDLTSSDAEFEPFVFAVESFAEPEPSPIVEPSVDEEPFAAHSPQITHYKILDTQPDTTQGADNSDSTVRIPVRQLNQLNDLFGELTIERNGLNLHVNRLRHLSKALRSRMQTLEQINAQIRTAYDQGQTLNPTLPLLSGSHNGDYSTSRASSSFNHAVASFKFDALELDRYNDLHTLSQQVMETIVQIQEITDDVDLSLDDTEQTTRVLNKTAKQLQTGLTQLRMRPLADVVDRFPRALRDLSLQFGKPVDLKVTGANTLIDRNVLEALNDPLMHLLRNAFDHGIEDSATRRSRGKGETGQIEIHAVHRGNRTIITIRDDGEGIPIHKIRDRAEQMGLDPTLLDAASDEELLSLIFEPGFSTNSQVTTLSGRGVGMDVVRSNLKDIRGEINVNTQAGVGTTFTLSLPFTLSVVRILLAESNGMLLAFPTDMIQEMFLLKPEQIISSVGNELLNWQGKLVQLVRLNHWLDFNCPHPPHNFETPATIRSACVLIVQQGNQLAGLQVDRCWDEQEVTIRRVEGLLPLPTGFSSCTILGDGRVVPLVNIPDLLKWIASYERFGADTPLPDSPNPVLISELPHVSSTQTILIVDDSIHVRRFLALMLERAGYQVEQAKDGQEALERLNTVSVTAVICDVEMPRLDGFGFLAKLKAHSQFSHLPVAMLTSRNGNKHRQLATQLGAVAYFTKPYNEQDLLNTLTQIIAAAH
ncbi:response regulator [Phormidesmis sp. 146-12]